MTDTLFERALRLVLDIEGGWGDDPEDPGGETNLGITGAALAEAKRRALVPKTLLIRTMTRPLAAAIYHALYWREFGCHLLPEVLAIALFDGVVNQPGGAVVEMLQTSLRVKVDGDVGPATARAAEAADQLDVLTDFFSRRALRYSEKSKPKFQRGLFRRLFVIERRLVEGWIE